MKYKIVIINYDQLSRVRKENLDKKIVFCSGTFDLTYIGHIIFLEECKKYGDILVVGVGSDRVIKKYKGNKRTILSEEIL